MTWGTDQPGPRIITYTASTWSKTQLWTGIAIQASTGDLILKMHQDRTRCRSRTMSAAIAIEKALELAHQNTWTTIEIWMHNSEVITPLSKEDDKPIEASPLLEHFRQYFACCIFRQVSTEQIQETM